MANQALRQEINLICGPSTSTGTLDIAGITCIMDPANFSGSPTYWFEAVYSGAASNTGTIDFLGGTATVSLAGATSATKVLGRVQFTAQASAATMAVRLSGDGTRSQTVYAARVIILQSESAITKTETQIEIGNQTAALSNTTVADITNPKFWKYNSANWDGTLAFAVEVSWLTSAKNTTTITLCRTSDNAANVTVVNAGTGTTYNRTRVSFTPVNGETYKLRSLGSTTKSTYTIANAKIIVTQTVSVTKCEPQMLLLNTADSGTGAQGMLTKYTASEWNADAGSNTITHLMDSDNSSNSAKIVTAAGADTGSSSAATGATQAESGSFTLIDATNYDTNVTNSTGVVAGSRLKFVYVYVAATATYRGFVRWVGGEKS